MVAKIICGPDINSHLFLFDGSEGKLVGWTGKYNKVKTFLVLKKAEKPFTESEVVVQVNPTDIATWH